MFKVKNFSQQQSSHKNSNKNHAINCWNSSSVSLVILSSIWGTQPLNAQEVNLVAIKDGETKTTRLEHSQVDLLIVSTPATESAQQPEVSAKITDETPEKIVVKNFNVVGSSVFSQEELINAIKSYQNRPLTLPELFQARSAITKLYTDKGYVNSGAYIPPQELNNGTIKIAVLEGQLEGINVTGTKHLNPSYIEKRIKSAAGVPVNVDSLLEALQLLRLDPLIANVSAELSAGVRPGTSLLDIEVEEADVFNLTASYNNGRSPSVGTIQRSISLNYGNLLGFGDKFNFNYTNSKGSNSFDFAYGFPVNAKNGTIRMAVGTNSNEVVEEPFTPLDIESESHYYELNFRQPIILKPEQEFALGLSFSRQASDTFLYGDIPFYLSRGADNNGETRISAFRFYQEYVNRDESKVFALRSQFSVGVDLFNATINDDAPDSTFFAWRGQSQWVRRLGEDFLFLVRGDVQLAGSSLVPLEQFRVGGVDSARGYRQDLSLGDSGVFTSAELRVPIFRISKIDGLVQIAPFVDVGTLWNNDDVEIENSTLPSVGLGLNFSAGESFNARLDWGIPLTDVKNQSGSLQEDGVYFSLNYNFF
ncbi:MAG: ShlB/FhaC/HecB family hemolysin secretion/activation protein [Pleurocapsa sp.]